MAANWPDAKLLTPTVFGVIAATVTLHGLSVRPLARRLGLAAREGNGILLVGASRWSTDLGLALTKAGCDVILSDNRYRRVSQARQQGLQTHYGNLLHEEVDLELPLERISWVFAASDLDSNNALICLHYRSTLGREHTLQLARAEQESGADASTPLEGRNPWGSQTTYDAITRRWWQGARFKVTKLSTEYSLENLRQDNPEGLQLFAVHEERLRPITDETQELPVGAKVVTLV